MSQGRLTDPDFGLAVIEGVRNVTLRVLNVSPTWYMDESNIHNKND